MAAKLSDMSLFKAVDEGFVIVKAAGIYKQVGLYERNGGLYAENGAGFVRLLKSGGTSSPKVTWDSIEGVRIREGNQAQNAAHLAAGVTLAR